MFAYHSTPDRCSPTSKTNKQKKQKKKKKKNKEKFSEMFCFKRKHFEMFAFPGIHLYENSNRFPVKEKSLFLARSIVNI